VNASSSLRAACAALTAATLFAPAAACAAVLNYNVTVKGTSTTLNGQKFRFTGEGTMTVDDKTGAATFNIALNNGTTIDGAGTAGAGTKNVFANIEIDQTGGAEGVGIIAGKLKNAGARFQGKFTVGIPNRLGPAPGGFVYTTGTIKATRVK
jgi:hypothetical protein